MKFPIESLNHSVSKSLSRFDVVYKAVLDKGLHNEIILTEKINGHNVFSEIDENGQVYISPSFCQFIWNISYAALIITDTTSIMKELNKVGINKDMFLNMLSGYEENPEIGFIISELNAMPWDNVLVTGYYCLKKHITQAVVDNLKMQDMTSIFSQKVNGIYQAGITFVLLHELYHWERGHFWNTMTRIDKEKEADDYAFRTILLNNFTDNEMKTYIVGSICVLFSFFFNNPSLHKDERYPYEDDRLFAQFDKLKSPEMENCRSLIIQILKEWAKFFNIDNFPQLTGVDMNDLYNIRKFLECYKKKCNSQYK